MPKRFIECTVPVTACNMRCSYCYVMQEGRRTNKMPEFKYTPEHIGKALSKERLGGTCYVNICGLGETLLPKEMPDILENILKQGHYINVTTNGTITERFNEIIKMPHEYLERLNFAFSFHYLELIRLGKMDEFFNNVKKVRKAGCSFVVQLNLCDDYIPYLDEIKKICKDNIGAYPQLAATRDEEAERIKLLTNFSEEEYKKLGEDFKSPLFEFTMKNFMVPRKEFCYAGDWSFLLDLSNGDARKCYHCPPDQNIFKNLNKPIRFEAVGNNCYGPYCVNSSHFMSLGIIPSIDTPTYADLRNRKSGNWYSKKMYKFLSQKFIDNNKEYNKLKKLRCNLTYKYRGIERRLKRITKQR